MGLFEEGGQTGIKPRGSYDVKVRYEGDWVRFGLLIRSTDILLAAAAKAGQEAFAEAYRDAVKKNMREGGRRFGYAPMAPDYAEFKARRGGGTKLFNWSGEMVEAVEVIPNHDGTRHMVGIPEGQVRGPYYPGEGNKLTISEYANALEHGYATKGVYVEPRPIFSDTFKFTMGGKEGIRKYIEASIIGTLGSKGIRVSKKFIR